MPIKTKTHHMDLNFAGSNLFVPRGGQVFVPTIQSLFNDHFESVEDFLLTGVFEPKGLSFKRRQRKTGFGDIYFFASVDVARYFCYFTSFEFGTSLVLPTASRPKETVIWEPLLGNSVFQFGFFTNMILDTSSSLAHPTLRFGAELSASCCGKRRMQSTVSIDNGATSGVLVGSTETGYIGHTVRGPISETDATTPLLADIAFDANVGLGSRIFFGVGNYFYNVFYRPFRMGVFWDVDLKRADNVSVSDKQGRTFTAAQLEARTVQRAHRFSWNLHYRSDSGIEAGVGSAHVVLGRNVPKTHEFFLTFVALF